MKRMHFADPADGKPLCRRTTDHLTTMPCIVSCRHCRTKMERHFKPAGEAFVLMVTTWLKSNGATDGSFYELVLETAAGLLHISPRPTHINCRFADVERAKKLLGDHYGGRLNIYSGKWNWTFDLGAGTEELVLFKQGLRPLLCWDTP